jgi:hypothetical protein
MNPDKSRLTKSAAHLVAFMMMSVILNNPASARSRDSYKFETFDLRGSRYFSNYNAVVGRYLREKRPHRRARACVVGLKVDERGGKQAWVIWRGGDKLILWGGEGNNDLNRSNRLLSIRNDVVEDIGTSTYLESRSWFDALEQKCNKFGRYVTVN